MVDILFIEFFAQKLDRLTKPLEVYDLTLTKEFDHIIYIWIIAQAKYIIIGHPCFLFWHAQSFATK